MLILYDYDGNNILEIPINNNQADTICDAFQYINNILKSKGNAPNLYITDNEAYSEIKKAMTK